MEWPWLCSLWGDGLYSKWLVSAVSVIVSYMSWKKKKAQIHTLNLSTVSPTSGTVAQTWQMLIKERDFPVIWTHLLLHNQYLVWQSLSRISVCASVLVLVYQENLAAWIGKSNKFLNNEELILVINFNI